MKSNLHKVLGAALLAGALLLRSAGASTTNAVPWCDSFESYANGASIIGTNGWTGDSAIPASGMVSTDPATIALLTNYVAGGLLSYPLASATHTTVLQTATVSTNDVHGATGGVVAVEFMVLPSAQPATPADPANLHYAFFVDTNCNLVIWHQNQTGGVTNNEWRTLTGGPIVATNAWSRFTVVQDYIHNMFQIRVNESTNAVTDPAGWSSPGLGGAQPGSWFHMVKTNAWLSHVMVGGDATYIDDLLLTNRCVSWSTNRFVESDANDGSVDPSTAFDISVRYDTLAGTNGQVLDASAVTVTNVPAGLTGVVTRLDATHLRLTLTGQALPNEITNGVTNLTVVLKDGAFTLGNAADVIGASNTSIVVSFWNHAALTFDSTHFAEAAANNGSISNTLTLSLTTATFTNVSPLVAGTHYTVANVPQGLAFILTPSGTTTAVARLTGNAATHRAADGTNLNLTFLDAAFTRTAASNVTGSATNLVVTFLDPPVLAYSATAFTEAAANDGTISNTIAMTLTGDTFTNAVFTAGVHYTASAVPTNLTLSLVRTSSSNVTASLTGTATAHAASNSLASIGFAFLTPAFNTVAAGDIVGSATNLAVSFADPPVLSAAGTSFAEAAANNGSIGSGVTLMLTGATFVNATFASNTHYIVVNVPTGLTFGITRVSDAQLTATLSGQAVNHLAANSISNLTVTFLNAAFNTVQAANVAGHTLTFAVTFTNQPALAYSRKTFVETCVGLIDNRTPMTITLAGDTFVADVATRIAVANLPGGLSAAFTRDTPTQLSVRLNGAATNNASSDSISNLTFTFQSGAFSFADVNQVDNYVTSDLRVTFVDDPGFFNLVPYAESFESYANGLWLAGTNGWTADYQPNAGVITNDVAVAGNLALYTVTHPTLPIVGTHAQVLAVTDSLRAAIHSEAAPLVYVDFMTQPVVLEAPPGSSYTNLQYAFYVSTNRQLTIWHRNVTSGSNEWLTLQNSPLIDTSRWTRFTVAQDYTHQMFQLQVNELTPIPDPAGWTDAGAAHTGSWFYMVQTNGTMSHFIVAGSGQAYVDDLTVRASLSASFGGASGVVYKFR